MRICLRNRYYNMANQLRDRRLTNLNVTILLASLRLSETDSTDSRVPVGYEFNRE